MMIGVEFAPAIQRHVACVRQMVGAAATVREALDVVFAHQSSVRAYVLDDQGALRKHIALFIDGEQVRDRKQLSDKLGIDAQIYIVQALSGG